MKVFSSENRADNFLFLHILLVQHFYPNGLDPFNIISDFTVQHFQMFFDRFPSNFYYIKYGHVIINAGNFKMSMFMSGVSGVVL